MSDKIEKSGLAIGGLGITYQATIIDGKTLAFETAVDQTMDRKELDEFMDTFIGAAKRQQAIEELPLVKQSLHANKATLAAQIRARAEIIAGAQARMGKANENRRVAREMSDGDKGSIAQFDQRISQLKTAIAAAEARVPYLEAIIDRRDPPEMFPVLGADEAEAA